jgi:hypothetical protein
LEFGDEGVGGVPEGDFDGGGGRLAVGGHG